MSEDIPTSGGFWATVVAICMAAAGGLGVAVKAWFNRKRTEAVTERTEAETEKAEAEAELLKAKVRALDAETDGTLLGHVRAEYRLVLEELSELRGHVVECQKDREAIRKLMEEQARQRARDSAKHEAERTVDRSIIDGLRTRVGKLESALTQLGKDPKLVS